MELVANIWPIVDQMTGIVQRFLFRAYALEATDQEISTVLTILARSDYRIAQVAKIPDNYKLSSEHGTMSGAVEVAMFNQYMHSILEDTLIAAEKSFADMNNYGIGVDGPLIPKTLTFPAEPYLVTTYLLESPSGELTPHIKAG
ncbi:hypothetical protein GCM10016272_22170 [Psychrobacter glaciei]|uniref:Uncharacterized protein n=1 Tax=Psychrobacter glaciei TaxID=619771 RepID=A0ABQ3GSM2_9GAMM|nr:hypothetical protein [Psychrobacter glaciei]GHD35819.1 hypothetical protein GCM10016272_22170 [Psychrobacter glaciei]